MDLPILRKAAAADAPVLAGILRQTGWWPDLSAMPEDKLNRAVARRIAACRSGRDHLLIVAELGGRAVGYANMHVLPYLFLSGPEGYVSELFVLEEARGLGVGEALVRELRQAARRRGCSRLMLLTSRTRTSYERGFYTRQGFTERTHVANFVLPL